MGQAARDEGQGEGVDCAFLDLRETCENDRSGKGWEGLEAIELSPIGSLSRAGELRGVFSWLGVACLKILAGGLAYTHKQVGHESGGENASVGGIHQEELAQGWKRAESLKFLAEVASLLGFFEDLFCSFPKCLGAFRDDAVLGVGLFIADAVLHPSAAL